MKTDSYQTLVAKYAKCDLQNLIITRANSLAITATVAQMSFREPAGLAFRVLVAFGQKIIGINPP